MKSKKIVMLQDFYGIDSTYQENLLTKYYQKLGHSVVVISSTYESVFDYVNDNHDKTKKQRVDEEFGAKIIRLPYSINILNKVKKHEGVFEIIEKEHPDLIFVHDIHLNLSDAVRYVKKNPKCKIIMDYHADYSNSGKNWISINVLHKIIRKIFLYKYLKYIDKIYPVVPGSAHFLNEVYGISHSKMTLLPLGCDYDKSLDVMESTNKDQLRSKFKIRKDDLVLITGGKFHPLKKTEVLIEAIENIKDQSIHLIIFGKADHELVDYEAKLKTMAKSSNIHFTGWISNNDALEHMTISDIAIFPSSQSVLWQQAIGMHLPLIVGDLGGQDTEYLNFNNNIITIKTKDINSKYIEGIILNLKANPDLLFKMKDGAMKTASEILDYRIICNKTLEVFEGHSEN